MMYGLIACRLNIKGVVFQIGHRVCELVVFAKVTLHASRNALDEQNDPFTICGAALASRHLHIWFEDIIDNSLLTIHYNYNNNI